MSQRLHSWPFSHPDWWKEKGGENQSCVLAGRAWQVEEAVCEAGLREGSVSHWFRLRQLKVRASALPETVPRKKPGLG